MSNPFHILIDRLKNGSSQAIDETLNPEFLEIEEEDLRAESEVKVKGKAYLTESELILNLNAATKVMMPCSICNQMTHVDLAIENFYHAHPLDEIPSGVYSFKAPLREALLIELPKYAECNQGKCPKREDMTPYLKEKKQNKDTHFPFSDLV